MTRQRGVLTHVDKVGLLQSLPMSTYRDELGYSIKKHTLDKLQTRLKIPTVCKLPPVEISQQAVMDEVAKDPLQLNDPVVPLWFTTWSASIAVLIGVWDLVHKITHNHFDAGFTLRFPGHQKERIPRVGLSALGRFYELSAQALQLGELSLPIYAYKDKWTNFLLMLHLIPNSQTATAIGNLFLDFVDKTGCIPLQVTTDKGSEIGCEALAPGIDPLVYAVYMVLKSVHNTAIEGFWCWLRGKMGLKLKEFITCGKQDHVFDSNVAFHVPLFHWIFVPIIQEQLDEFRAWWNNHRVCLQRDKNMPSGHIPVLAVEYPDHLGGIDCCIHVPKEAAIELHELLTEEVGSRKSHLTIWEDIGSPAMSVDSTWDIFAQMSDVIENFDYACMVSID
ncbi:hypothetical protein B0H14DRAFT_3099097 [Mycena olivaceomarginata]|nr:hypothetical protein B0H14DRAFT_3099097 [Mycena olivaceomarginata]